MYAIIETGGKQIRVEKDAVIFVEKLEANEGDTVTFDKVLYADGKFGKPFVEGAKVTGVVEKQGKGKKITIVKYKAKKSSTRRKQGHRQPYTRVKIEAMEFHVSLCMDMLNMISMEKISSVLQPVPLLLVVSTQSHSLAI